MTTTHDRVPSHTADEINRQIQQAIERNIHRCRQHPEGTPRRLRELDEEWDIERAIEANAATLSLVGLTFGAFGSRRWFLLPAAVSAFLLQHAIQGWCPPVPILRRLGFRTADEINQERQALKLLRGDFAALGTDPQPAALQAAIRA